MPPQLPLCHPDLPTTLQHLTYTIRTRLETVYDALTLTVRTLHHRGDIIYTDAPLTAELDDFANAVGGRRAEAVLLGWVWGDVDHASDTAGEAQESAVQETKGTIEEQEKRDTKLRRLRTLQGLEKSLVCWEKIGLGLVELMEEVGDGDEDDGREGQGWSREEITQGVWEVVDGWKEGLLGM